jgi:hypothetical protein
MFDDPCVITMYWVPNRREAKWLQDQQTNITLHQHKISHRCAFLSRSSSEEYVSDTHSAYRYDDTVAGPYASNTDRVTILAIYTGLKMKRRNSITALCKWLICRRTQKWHDLLLGVWTLTHWRTKWKRIRKEMDMETRKQRARKAHRSGHRQLRGKLPAGFFGSVLHRRRPAIHSGLARR